MSPNLHPENGVRVLFELDSESAEGARYRAAIFSPADRVDYRLEIAASDGQVTLTATAKSAPEEHETLLRNQARVLGRQKVKNPAEPWPKRILRWRDA